jgi:hypothetical protein
MDNMRIVNQCKSSLVALQEEKVMMLRNIKKVRNWDQLEEFEDRLIEILKNIRINEETIEKFQVN